MTSKARTVWVRGEYRISTNKSELDIQLIHGFLSNSSYWGRGRSIETVKVSIENSLCFGLYNEGGQVGFSRVITDFATFAWMADVFVFESFRGQGLGKWLVSVVMAHPQLQGLRRWLLATRDAHELYRRFGFREITGSNPFMSRFEEKRIEE